MQYGHTWDAYAVSRSSRVVWANNPGDGTGAPQGSWACLMDDGVGTELQSATWTTTIKWDIHSLAFVSPAIARSPLYSWVDWSMWVKFLAQGNTNSNWALNLEPCNYQADAPTTWLLLPHTLTYTYTHTHTCACTHMYTHIHSDTHSRTHIHVHTHTHTHAHTLTL